jgi:hypothetical protein
MIAFSGTLASTCLAVLFVPACFVMVQRFADAWRFPIRVLGSRRAV